MSGTARIWTFVSILAVGVVAAVSAAVAQGTPPMPDVRGPDDRRELRILEGRGSRLGVMVQDPDTADQTPGVRIESVNPGSPAEKAGLKAGDIVVEYDGERVRSSRQFSRLVQETPEGRQVPLAIVRDGERRSLTATPEARSFAWEMGLDGEQLQRDIERGLERGLQGLRGFRMDDLPQRFRFDRNLDGFFAPTSRRRLGISVDSLSGQLAQYFGASEGGALVTEVDQDSAAAKAGLRAGDVITSINGERVRDAAQVADSIRKVGEGEVTIGYLRDKTEATTKATIEPRPAGRVPARPAEPRRPIRPAALMRPA